jgi:hypothetical protein
MILPADSASVADGAWCGMDGAQNVLLGAVPRNSDHRLAFLETL